MALPLLLHLLLRSISFYIYTIFVINHYHNFHFYRSIWSNLETVELFFKFLYQLFRFRGSLARHLQTICNIFPIKASCNKYEYLPRGLNSATSSKGAASAKFHRFGKKQIGTSMISAQQQQRLCRRLLFQPLLHVSPWLEEDSFNSKLFGKERKMRVLNLLTRQPLNTSLNTAQKTKSAILDHF